MSMYKAILLPISEEIDYYAIGGPGVGQPHIFRPEIVAFSLASCPGAFGFEGMALAGRPFKAVSSPGIQFL